MKLLKLLLLSVLYTNAQELPKVIPPSPNASAFHVYGNTQVSNYTGAPNISIPIHTIKEGNLTLPIYLKYTGGNGIKVEEIASWVGLGWTLNTGGSISRIIRGVADEDDTKLGFLKRSTGVPVPNLSNYQEIRDMSLNRKDSEPDKFMYNFTSGSGSFFFDHDSNIYLKPMGKINISYTEGSHGEPIFRRECTTMHSVIKDFTIIDEYGNRFFFNEKERSNTVTHGTPFEDTRGFPTTWHIKKIENRLKTNSIQFNYDTYSYQLKRLKTILSKNMKQLSLTSTVYLSKRLKKITYSAGSIEFVASTDNRKDLENNKYLDYILIKDLNGKVTKRIKFKYKYMTASGFMDVNSNLSYSESNRLILTAIQECSGQGEHCKPETKLTYDVTHSLPSRQSSAQDHWGYFNGKTSNTILEPKQYITWYDPISSSWKTEKHGSADRYPNFIYSKSGVLTEIEYPTGGKTLFNYESHTAINNQVSGSMIDKIIELNQPGMAYKIPFTVSLSSKANPLTEFNVSPLAHAVLSPFNCGIKIHVKNKRTGIIKYLSPINYPVSTTIYPSHTLLESGDYEAWYTLENEYSCVQDEIASIPLQWDNESSSDNKIIGGLRISSITDLANDGRVASKRRFNYNDTTNASTGRLVNVPRYYGITSLDANGYQGPLSYFRYVYSTIPLGITQGSNIGYGKVTVTHVDSLNNNIGKEEFHYTTADPSYYPDNIQGINPFNGDIINYTFQGVQIPLFPAPEVDDQDFLRGVLLKHSIFKVDSTSKRTKNYYSKVYEKINTYERANYFNRPLGGNIEGIGDFTRTIKGLKAFTNNGGGVIDITYYNIYSGYNLPIRTTINYYNNNNSEFLQETTIQDYKRNVDGFATHYLPVENTFIDSVGMIRKTETTYVFNTTAESALKDENAIYVPLTSKSFISNTQLSEQNTIYSDFNGLYLPEKIQILKGDNSGDLEDRIIYHDYDTHSNPLEVSKADGTHIIYIWGYNNTQPIAKIENATYNGMPSNVRTLINQIKTASNTENTEAEENSLRDLFTQLRTHTYFTNAQVTTYTYDPLIGVTSITDPRGYTTYYDYDDFNRLKHVKDQDGNILSQNEYNYRAQN